MRAGIAQTARWLAAGVLLWGGPAGAAETSEPLSALSATTGSLRAGTHFFDTRESETKTTLPLTSVVVDETSKSAGVVTAPPTADNEQSTVTRVEELMTTTPPAAPAERLTRLPLRVDRSSTAALEMQVQKFERRNQIGEAYLLSRELLRENPNAEFALNAAIRSSLVLGREADTESLYRDAVRASSLPGKYFVQLAHFYSRTGRMEQLAAISQDYEKNHAKDPDYWISMARLAAVAEDTTRTQSIVERAAAEKVSMFPLTQMAVSLYRSTQQHQKARELILAAMDQDIGPWEKRALFIEFLKLPFNRPADIGRMVRATLANETNYRNARGMADIIISRCLEQRLFYPLKAWLAREIAEGRSADIEYWLAAVMARHEGATSEALALLTSPATGNTPVISYERAVTLAAEGRFSEATPILSVLLAEQPTDVPIRLTLAEQYLAAGNPDYATEVLAALQPSQLEPRERLRMCEVSLNAALRSGKAARVLDAWVELAEAANFQDLQAMGDIVLRSLTDADLARELTELVNERISRPKDWPLLLLRARLAAAEGDHKAELDYYTRYLENDWDNVQMLRFVAELCTQYASLPLSIRTPGTEGEQAPVPVRAVDYAGTDLAIRLYRRLIELQPIIADNYSALMRILQLRGEVETAKKVALELTDRKTSSAEVQATAAAILDENGFALDALSFYEKSLQLAPDDLSVWMKYADALRAAGQYDRSSEILRRILETGLHGRPFAQPQVFASLLRVANDSGTVPQLLDYLDTLRAKEIPGKADFYLSAAKLCVQVKSDDRAEALLVEFQQKHRDDALIPDSHLLLGQIQFGRRETQKALESFRAVIQRFPGTPAEITARFNIGEVQRQSGQLQEAVTSWVELANKRPDDDRALAGLFEAAVTAAGDLKDPALAKRLFQLYIDSGPQDFTLLRRARSDLAALEKGMALPEGEAQ